MEGGESLEFKKSTVLGLRVFQLICASSIITGFIWATADLLLTTILVDSPVTPLSVLLMVYGTLGIVLCEATVRLLSRNQPKK